ncbi:MAG: SUMF1/EgtB/PvdO family nonheme iron enzyme [Byssovorax sp.]
MERTTFVIPFFFALAALGSLGCAGGELNRGSLVAQAPSGAGFRATLLAARARPKEAVSRAEGAAFFALRVAPANLLGTALGAQAAAILPAAGTLLAPSSAPSAADALLRAVDRCPADMALVDGRVCVDKWEGSIVEIVPGGPERLWSPYVPIDGHESSVRAVSRPGVIPQGYISGKQAEGVCRASGKRLCASGEWQNACRGPEHTQFPYGDTRRAGVCNDDIRPVHPVPEAGVLLGITGGHLWSEGMNQAIINQLPDTLLPTGERAECTNGYGVFDMVGNLHEWVDEPDGTFRGGYYMDTSHNGEGCSYATTAHDFTYHDYSTGFRCCMDPDGVE